MEARPATAAGPGPSAPAHVGRRPRVGAFLRRDLQITGLAGAVAMMVIVGIVTSPVFLTATNLLNVARQGSIVALLGLAVTVCLIAGIVDFTIGAVLALGSVGIALTAGGNPLETIALLVGLVIAIGAVKAFLIAFLELESLITTLGIALALEGAAFAWSDQQLVPVSDAGWRWLGSGEVAGIPASLLTVAAAAIVAGLVLRRTVWGKYLYATGSNPIAARIAGVPTRSVMLGALLVATALSVLAAVVFVGRVAAGDPGVGTGFALDAVVVAVLGGASLFGGRGSVIGLLLAATLLALMFNVFTLLGLETHWQMVARGAILVSAISLDVLRRR